MHLQTKEGAPAAAAPAHGVIELRQYKIVPGQRDAMITLFERRLIEGQEQVGMSLLGQFRDLDDPNRFTWLRGFADMAARERALQAFYSGPVWLANRDAANATLEDNDNVLLLRPATPGSAFRPALDDRAAAGSEARSGELLVATILSLWKDPAEGFAEFFDTALRPELEAAGLPVVGACVTETEPNTFPRLPVRQHEKLFVWFTRVADAAVYETALQRLSARPRWLSELKPRLDDAQERAAQVLRLQPTPRSR